MPINQPFLDLNFPNCVVEEKDFFNRDRERERIKFHFQQNIASPLVILGERRIGKTSLLNVSLSKLNELGFAYVSPTLNNHRFEFFAYELLSEACLKFKYPTSQTGMFDGDGNFHWRSVADYMNALRRIFEAAGGQRLVVVIDELDEFLDRSSEDECRELLVFIQQLIQDPELRLLLRLLVVMTRPSELIERSFASNFFSISKSIELHPFERKDADHMAQTLLDEWQSLDDEALTLFYRLSGGHPYFAKLLLECLHNRYHDYDLRSPISPEMLEEALRGAIHHTHAKLIISNIMKKHMKPAEVEILTEVVRSGGNLTGSQIRNKPAAWNSSVQELIERGYLQSNANDEYTFRIEYLYHFLQQWQNLLLDLEPAIAKLRVVSRQVIRGKEHIELDKKEDLECLIYLYEHRQEIMVRSIDIFDHVYPGKKFGANEREIMLGRLIDQIRHRIEYDPRHPIYLVDEGSGYRLENAE